MIKITPSTPISNTSITRSKREVDPVEPVVPDKKINAEDTWPFVERRKSGDRRKNRRGNGPYETRSGGDRRKNSRSHPSIDTDA